MYCPIVEEKLVAPYGYFYPLKPYSWYTWYPIRKVAVRKQGEGDKGTMKIEEFGKNLAEEVSNMINKW